MIVYSFAAESSWLLCDVMNGGWRPNDCCIVDEACLSSLSTVGDRVAVRADPPPMVRLYKAAAQAVRMH